MTTAAFGLGLVIAIVALVVLIAKFRVAAARRSGLLPAAGQATMADVKRLTLMGERVWAIRCYREIHRCGLAEASGAIKALYPIA